MLRSKKLIALTILMLLILPLTPIRAYAANPISSTDPVPTPQEYNLQIEKIKAAIEFKYQILIKYPIRPDGYAAIGNGSLATLDLSLSYLSSDTVQELSEYYYVTYGAPLTFEFTYRPQNFQQRDIAALGFFDSKKSLIQLFIPDSSSFMTTSGCGPFTILHEVGHAYYVYLSNRAGKEKLNSDWLSFNGSIPYQRNASYNPNRETFVSVYASSGLEEDFAETFSYMFVCNRPGLGIAYRFVKKDGTFTGLGKKVNYLSGTIEKQFKNPSNALASIEKMKQTSAILHYDHARLSGNSLEYIGFTQPQGILPNILKTLKIRPVSEMWLTQIGGWMISDIAGGTYLVFPGCGYVTLKIPTRPVSVVSSYQLPTS